jgi:hypothetical protein
MKSRKKHDEIVVRADAHAAMLESAAALMALDGFGLDPDNGFVEHLRRMAGAMRADAALGKRAQAYTGKQYLPRPAKLPEATSDRTGSSVMVSRVWH